MLEIIFKTSEERFSCCSGKGSKIRTKIRFIFDRSQQKTVKNKQFCLLVKLQKFGVYYLSTSLTENSGTLQEKWKLR